MRAALLAALACASCATSLAPPSDGPANATPISALAHGADLLEGGQPRRFLDELMLPSELAEMKKEGRYERTVKVLEEGHAPMLAASLRRATAWFPRVRSDGALVFDGQDRSKPFNGSQEVALVARAGRWYITRKDPDAPPPPPLLLFVRIPRSDIPRAGGRSYDEVIDRFMRARRAGKVTGSGGGVDGDDRDYVGIDVEITDSTRALPLLRAKLRALGAPKGTVIIEGRGVGATLATGLAGPTKTHAVW